MSQIPLILQSIVEDIELEELPGVWSNLDTVSFSRGKKLWEFQQEALKNAIKAMYLYFKAYGADKEKFYERYQLNGLDADLERELELRRSKIKGEAWNLLREYYTPDGDRIRFHNFINRAAFWMATGSGKTLLIVKLVEALKTLMDFGEIPKKDILVLTHRDDLIKQIKRHVEEFNELAAVRGFRIDLVELTEYERIKRENQIGNGVRVFYYRSDLISDDKKEKLVDFRDYENGGNWYIILDEAHKGDKEESKRQMYYSIMSRKGFLFNFSATFTDPRDIVTTTYNFNLAKFISGGYGKHIYVLKHEVRAFKEKEDYSQEEKQKIVLKSLILLTYLKKIRKEIKKIREDVYHEPLLLTLVNTVNLTDVKKEKPDLTLFFEEIARIGRGDVEKETFERAKEELLGEFSENPKLEYEDMEIEIERSIIENLTLEDILKHVYNAESFGSVEAIIIPGTKREAVFKLKTSDKPFALVRIGDAAKWIGENLTGYEVMESYEDRSIFEDLNNREEISILMGSRAFYEGWDSNRPNIILFINIGVRTDARKFVLQAIGRGVRIEPIKGKRKRLQALYKEGKDEGLFKRIGKRIQPLETLFVVGTNRNALSEVMATLKTEREAQETLELVVNTNAREKPLLIPVFRTSEKKLYQDRNPQKFYVPEHLFNLLREYFTSTDDRVLVVQNNLSPTLLAKIRMSFNEKDRYYHIVRESAKIPLEVTVQRLISHFSLNAEELNGFKDLEGEIVHFKRIKVSLGRKDELKELKEKIEKVSSLRSAEERFKDLRIKHVANHYYLPLILSEDRKADYIKHVIKTESEVRFIEDLERYLEKKGNNSDVDWWMFSKIDEHLDSIYIPYYDPEANRVRKFKPDFVFWFKRGRDYFIVFVDPKGTAHTGFEHKVDWFRRFFGEADSPRIFEHKGFRIRVLLYFYTVDRNRPSDAYREYWLDSVESLFNRLKELA
ncbi:DEAD/DEAH box helicase family protein [Thermococcus stetteri]|uniref:DEAD/DEAH box helicase family protein n=1 Tax=Thermococcus stetteri TaxID=49900 RepID=UPI001AE78E21|nr:DEAD/DEAH box helicase family protein [Thermococcus stetteri]MBP1911486.1 superfamily II DNA or RNA helicase [Thermococcus stetteri]